MLKSLKAGKWKCFTMQYYLGAVQQQHSDIIMFQWQIRMSKGLTGWSHSNEHDHSEVGRNIKHKQEQGQTRTLLQETRTLFRGSGVWWGEGCQGWSHFRGLFPLCEWAFLSINDVLVARVGKTLLSKELISGVLEGQNKGKYATEIGAFWTACHKPVITVFDNPLVSDLLWMIDVVLSRKLKNPNVKILRSVFSG